MNNVCKIQYVKTEIKIENMKSIVFFKANAYVLKNSYKDISIPIYFTWDYHIIFKDFIPVCINFFKVKVLITLLKLFAELSKFDLPNLDKNVTRK